jgi:hypothetical protein
MGVFDMVVVSAEGVLRFLNGILTVMSMMFVGKKSK